MMQFKEEWRPVPFAPNYDVSSYGRIRSTMWSISNPYPDRDGPRYLSPIWHDAGNGRGYRAVHLCIYNEYGVSHGRRLFVHVIVAAAYLGVKPKKMDTCHNDGDTENNRIWNLRYDTRKGNLADKLRHNTQTRGESHSQAKLTKSQAVDIKFGDDRPCEAARKHGVSTTTIFDIRKGKSWKHLVERKP